MDPNATWKLLAEAFEQVQSDCEAWEAIEEHAENLMYWLSRGGFPPEITGHREFDRLVAKQTCDAILNWEVA